MPALDTITFDLWQTLIIDDRERGRARTQRRLDEAKEALAEEGLDFSIDVLREAYRSCFRACRAIHKDERDVSFEEQVRMFIDLIDEGLLSRLSSETVERITYWYAEAFFDYPPRVDPASRDVLEEMSRRGYRLGMISNTGMTPGSVFRRFLAQHDLLDFFHAVHLLGRGASVQAVVGDVPHDAGGAWDVAGEGAAPGRPHRERHRGRQPSGNVDGPAGRRGRTGADCVASRARADARGVAIDAGRLAAGGVMEGPIAPPPPALRTSGRATVSPLT